MAECPACGAALRDAARICGSCGAVVSTVALVKDDVDTRDFVRAGEADDPLTADELLEIVEQAGIPVVARVRRAGVVEPISSPSLHAWFEFMVPREHLDRARDLIDRESERIEREAEEAAAAAEEEEAENEAAAPGNKL